MGAGRGPAAGVPRGHSAGAGRGPAAGCRVDIPRGRGVAARGRPHPDPNFARNSTGCPHHLEDTVTFGCRPVVDARAMEIRCFCPPEMRTPRSPTRVSYLRARPELEETKTGFDKISARCSTRPQSPPRTRPRAPRRPPRGSRPPTRPRSRTRRCRLRGNRPPGRVGSRTRLMSARVVTNRGIKKLRLLRDDGELAPQTPHVERR